MGKPSFYKVIRNLDELRSKYPDYFDKYINFNSVLHNKNSVESIYLFIKKRYGKIPFISELNNMGIVPSKVKEFFTIYKNVTENLNQAEHYTQIEHDMFIELPSYKEVATFLIRYSNSFYDNYYSLLCTKNKYQHIQTGTCIPFAKKIFVTVNGKILACERIGHQFKLGQITKDGVDLNFKSIAMIYNKYLLKLKKSCTTCYRHDSCIQCIFNIHGIEGENPRCHGYMDKENFVLYVGNNISFLEEHRDDYLKIVDEVTIY